MRLRASPDAPRPIRPASLARRLLGLIRADAALYGSWSATRWHYTALDDHGRQVDLVSDRGGSVTLSLSEGTFVLTWDLGEGGRSVGGSVSVDGDQLTLRSDGAAEPEIVVFRVAGDTLALSSDASAWDLDGDGREEPAAFVAVLVRL